MSQTAKPELSLVENEVQDAPPTDEERPEPPEAASNDGRPADFDLDDDLAGEPTSSTVEDDWAELDGEAAPRRSGLKTFALGAVGLGALAVAALGAGSTFLNPEPKASEGPTMPERVTALEAKVAQQEVQFANAEAGEAADDDDREALRSEVATSLAALERVIADRSAESASVDAGLLDAVAQLRVAVEANETALAEFERTPIETPVQERAAPRRVQTLEPVAAAPAPTPTRLPFDVIAIDRWGEDTQLTVRARGRLQHLFPSEALGGWTFVSAERDAGVVRVQGPDGRTHAYDLADGFVGARSAAPTTAMLTVEPDVDGARVRIMNIVPVYKPGMRLAPGVYDVEVTAPGYATTRRWVRLGEPGQYRYTASLEPLS